MQFGNLLMAGPARTRRDPAIQVGWMRGSSPRMREAEEG
jgi:hypothetical protein